MKIHSLSVGTSVQIIGKVKHSPEGLEQAAEVHVTSVKIHGHADGAVRLPSFSKLSYFAKQIRQTFPLQKKHHTDEFLRSIPHLRPRTSTNALLLHVRSNVILALSEFFSRREYIQTHPPIITSSDCEGAGEVFTLAGFQAGKSGAPSAKIEHHFKTPRYLTVSTQLHLEALVHSVPRVWTLSPTFRAERSDTNRHLSEFYMLEAELYAERLGDVMDLTEEMLRHAVSAIVHSRVGKELIAHLGNSDEIQQRWSMLMDSARWPRITYTEAVELLRNAKTRGAPFQIEPEWGAGLSSEHERYIAEHFGTNASPGPVFVTDYPSAIKPFYMLPNDAQDTQQTTVACFDLLLPRMGEVVGGSLREHRYEELLRSMQAQGLIAADAKLDSAKPAGGLQWYADLRKWGSIPHGGYGLGFDRFLAWITGVENLREIVAFPRWHGRCDC